MKKVFAIKKILETSTAIADTYGFVPLHNFFESRKGHPNQKVQTLNKLTKKSVATDISAILKAYLQADMQETKQPLLVYFSNADKDTKSHLPTSKAEEEFAFTMAIFGIKESFAEAILLSAAHSIMEEITKTTPIIFINSMGDNSCSEKYLREVESVIRKYIESDKVSMKCIDVLNKRGTMEACQLIHNDDEFINLKNNLPSSIKFLNDSSSDHFQSVIEYLDAHGTPYTLSKDLIDDPLSTTHTIFKIVAKDHDSLYASGKRMDSLSQHLYEADVPVSYITVHYGKKATPTNKIPKKKEKVSKVFILHSGYKARLYTLPLIKTMRKNNIHVDHCIYHKKVADQLAQNEDKKYKFIFILGQKEILEGKIRVRNMNNKSQETVSLKNIISKLSKISS